MTARLKTMYDEQVFDALKEKFQYKNVMEVPKLEKVTINMGLGEAKDNAKVMESAVQEIALICGQKTCSDQGQKVHRQLQGETGYACRRQSHPQRRKHVCLC